MPPELIQLCYPGKVWVPLSQVAACQGLGTTLLLLDYQGWQTHAFAIKTISTLLPRQSTTSALLSATVTEKAQLALPPS